MLEKFKDLLNKFQFSFFFTNLIYPKIDYSTLYITPMKIKKIKKTLKQIMGNAFSLKFVINVTSLGHELT